MIDVIAVEMALEEYRKKNIGAYVGVPDTETIVGILKSAGLFGSMAAGFKRELDELQANIDKVVEEILA